MAQQKLVDALQDGISELQGLCWKLCTLFWVILMYFSPLCDGVNGVTQEWGWRGSCTSQRSL